MQNQIVSRSRRRILVADDEHVIADTLRTILDQNGFEVATAYCGATAVQAARLWRPDVFLSDVVMPEMNGIEAAIRIRSALPHCKILLFSGQAATSDLMQDAWVRGYDFEILVKPVHPNSLLARLQSLCADAA